MNDEKLIKEKMIYDHQGNVLVNLHNQPGKKITNKQIKEWLNIANIVVFISIFTTAIVVLAGINALSKYVYFGINLKLFSYDNKYIFVEAFNFILTWIMIVVFPIMLNRQNSYHFTSPLIKIFCFVLISIGILGVYGDLICNYYRTMIFPLSNRIIVIMVLVALHFAFYCFKYLIFGKFHNHIMHFNTKSFFSKFILILKCLFYLLEFVNGIIVYAILSCITVLNLVGVPQSNTYTEYSILQQPTGNKIVLFKAEDKLFIADFENDSENNCIIYTKQYQVVPFENIELIDITFKDIHIEKEKLKS